jgi:hypothetical protein
MGCNLLEYDLFVQLEASGTIAVRAIQTTGIDGTHVTVLFLNCGSYDVVCVYCSALREGVVVTS